MKKIFLTSVVLCAICVLLCGDKVQASTGGIATVLKDSTPSEEDIEAIKNEYNEYSNLAIADVTNYVNVRDKAGTDGAIVGKMYDGSVAQIQSQTTIDGELWFEVISGNVEGFIKAEYFIYGTEAFLTYDEYITTYALINADILNVRENPTTDSNRIGYVSEGEKIEIAEYGDEWTLVEYGDSQGYVATEYITVLEEFIYAKSIEEEQAELAMIAEQEERATDTVQENTTITVTPPATDYSSVSELRAAIVSYASQFLGNRYVHGGQTLAGGTDCSGFTCYVFREFGINLSRIPQGQWTGNGREVDVSQIQVGDIVCYSSSGGKCTHVGIYIGDGKIIHSANSRSGVIISDIYYDNTFIGVKNVID